MNVCDRGTLRELLGRHGFRFSKAMGQNFLIDPEIPRRIAEASGAGADCGVVEIGPGVGALTAELARRAGRVVAVELDRDLLPVLAETLEGLSNVEVVPGDALKLDLSALAAEKLAGLTPLVCANLPYNVATPLLSRLAETPCFRSVTVMVQREVARRVCAAPGTPDYGAFSLLMQYRMETELLFDVPRECFLPAPKVTSSVLRCVRRDRSAVEVADEVFFRRVVRGAFLLRRKTLVNSLSAALPGVEKETIRAAVLSAGLPEAVRGERLALEDFARLLPFLERKEI